jgi:AcrR family transcriptional regulator
MATAQLLDRDRIVDASLRVFYRDGIQATNVSQIIDEAGVSDDSFHRSFQSKDDLVTAYLRKRHEIWFSWFTTEVERRLAAMGGGLEVIADVLESWFEDPAFRGCAFINAVAEGGNSDSERYSIARGHKEQLKHFIEKLATRMKLQEPELAASAGVMVMDGAIVRAQMTGNSGEARNAHLLFECLNHS